jgi:hypothetical protein
VAKRYRPGDVKWVAYPEGVERVEVVERGCRGHVFRNGEKPENPYVVSEGGDQYVLGEAELHDNPVQASVAVAKMRSELGLAEFEDNEDEDGEEDDEEEEFEYEEGEDEDEDEDEEDEEDDED